MYNTTSANSNIKRNHIVVPYTKGLSEIIKMWARNMVHMYTLKGGRTIKDLLVAPKDKDHITKVSSIIYRFKCDRVECDDEYIAQPSGTFGARFKDYLNVPSSICDHFNTTGQTTTLENFSIVGRDEQNLMRLIKEAMYIRVNNPSLNINIGNYHLPHIWDEVLFNISELKIR